MVSKRQTHRLRLSIQLFNTHLFYNQLMISAVIIISQIFTANSAFSFPALFGVGPDNNQQVLLSALSSAKKSILLNAYEFEHPEILELLKNKIASGVQVQVLLEGEPVGRMGESSLKELTSLAQTMLQYPEKGNHVFIMMKSDKGSTHKEPKRRYHFDHAKYAVIDSRRAFITSENLSLTGHANRQTIGNRGWDTLLDSPDLAQSLTQTFQKDVDPSFRDIHELTQNLVVPTHSRKPSHPSQKRPIPAIPVASGEVSQAHLIYSPGSTEGLLEIIQKATHSIRMEELSLPLMWATGQVGMNPIVKELIEAARRNVRVQVLLNDDRVFEFRHGFDLFSEGTSILLAKIWDAPLQMLGSPRKNFQTAEYLKNLGNSEKIPLEAKIVDVSALKITYVHNKGMIIDDSGVLVSSINGTQNSMTHNREVGVFLESSSAAKYYGDTFDYDWQLSLTEIP